MINVTVPLWLWAGENGSWHFITVPDVTWRTSVFPVKSGVGTVNGNVRTSGSWLLAGLALTPSVPEPATWATMLLGFDAVGFALRRGKKRPQVPQVA